MRLGIPAIVTAEGVHGHLSTGATVFPHAIALGSTFDPELVGQVSTVVAKEALAAGVEQILSPVLDLARDARWGRCREIYGEDPYLTSRMGVAFIKGLQGEGPTVDDEHCAATPKHFAAHGNPEAGMNLAPVHTGERELHDRLLRIPAAHGSYDKPYAHQTLTSRVSSTPILYRVGEYVGRIPVGTSGALRSCRYICRSLGNSLTLGGVNSRMIKLDAILPAISVRPTSLGGQTMTAVPKSRITPLLVLLAVALQTAPCLAKTIYVKPTGSNYSNGLTWDTAKANVQAALSIAVLNDEIWVAAGSYTERITLRSGVAVYGGFLAGMTSRGERNPAVNVTTIDGNYSGVVVTAANCSSVTTLDGFTIRRGSGQGGVAVTCEWSQLHLIGNKLQDHTVFGSNSQTAAAVYCKGSSLLSSENTIGRTVYGGGIYGVDSTMTITNTSITGVERVGVQFYNSTGSLTGSTITANTGLCGVYCFRNSSPLIADNTITDNTSGGGIECADNSSPSIVRNFIARNRGSAVKCSASSSEIRGNKMYYNSSYYGGAVYCSTNGQNPVIADNVMIGNRGSYGGAVYCSGGGSPVIEGNRITGNISYHGGGINIQGPSAALVKNNVVSGNSATSNSGGGIYCVSELAVIANNTICQNSAGVGGGMDCPRALLLANNIVAFNRSGISCTQSVAPEMRNNCVFGNVLYDVQGFSADILTSNGNMSIDPGLAAQVFGDMRLQPDSPCLDAGDDSLVAAGDKDFEGEARVQGMHVDIGADESDGTLWPTAPAIVRVSTTGNDLNDGSGWDDAHAKRTVQVAVDSLENSGGEVWVKAGTYAEIVALRPFVHLYGGFRGDESDLTHRDWRANATIIDAQNRWSVIQIAAGHSANTVDGFTLINGKYGYDSDGGGISCRTTSPVIRNNVIANCVGYRAGGIQCWSGSPLIVGNIITRTECRDYWGGGAVYAETNASPVIDGNLIVDNSSTRRGGGVYADSTSVMAVTGNTIAYNRSTGDGAGVYATTDCRIRNNTIAFNSSGIRGTLALVLGNNCVYGNIAYDYQGVDPGAGDVSEDPCFIDSANGDYHIRFDSACIDAGDNRYASPADSDGRQRPLDGNVDGQAVVDIGIYEFRPIEVRIIVDPEGRGAPIKLTPKRLLTAAIPGGQGFDLGSIDATSITLGPSYTAREIHNRGHLQDVDSDGMLDLLLHFRCGDTGIQSGDTTVSLRGRFESGEPFWGSAPIVAW